MFDIIRATKLNFEIYRAMDGISALAICEKMIPDLVITDWDMPGMSGIELTKLIKKIVLWLRYR